MSNPFDQLGGNEQPEPIPDYELVGGAMSCQHTGCREVVNEGKYFAEAQLLTWKCPDGHISKITEIEL